MDKAVEHLRLAVNQLLRGRIGITPDTPASRAIDKANEKLKALIVHFNGGKSVPDARQSLKDVIDGLEPVASENDGARVALPELLEAQSALNATFFAVAPDGEITRKPRR